MANPGADCIPAIADGIIAPNPSALTSRDVLEPRIIPLIGWAVGVVVAIGFYQLLLSPDVAPANQVPIANDNYDQAQKANSGDKLAILDAGALTTYSSSNGQVVQPSSTSAFHAAPTLSSNLDASSLTISITNGLYGAAVDRTVIPKSCVKKFGKNDRQSLLACARSVRDNMLKQVMVRDAWGAALADDIAALLTSVQRATRLFATFINLALFVSFVNDLFTLGQIIAGDAGYDLRVVIISWLATVLLLLLQYVPEDQLDNWEVSMAEMLAAGIAYIPLKGLKLLGLDPIGLTPDISTLSIGAPMPPLTRTPAGIPTGYTGSFYITFNFAPSSKAKRASLNYQVQRADNGVVVPSTFTRSGWNTIPIWPGGMQFWWTPTYTKLEMVLLTFAGQYGDRWYWNSESDLTGPNVGTKFSCKQQNPPSGFSESVVCTLNPQPSANDGLFMLAFNQTYYSKQAAKPKRQTSTISYALKTGVFNETLYTGTIATKGKTDIYAPQDPVPWVMPFTNSKGHIRITPLNPISEKTDYIIAHPDGTQWTATEVANHPWKDHSCEMGFWYSCPSLELGCTQRITYCWFSDNI